MLFLLHKLSQLSLPEFVVNWISSFLSGRGQRCKINGLLSGVIGIGLSIVQGSGIGPTLYIIMKNDLCSISAVNDIFTARCYASTVSSHGPVSVCVCHKSEFY